ncbi:MAG TPA: hypothetical protein VFR41_10065, partial [Acidimicrobiia bacterium]|nr:hypothetical protein [Acidimicrobiia bacterium]
MGRSQFIVGCIALAAVSSCSSGSSGPAFAPPTTGAPSSIQPTGAFTKIAERTNDGLHWRLSQAPGAQGTTCWKLETGPSVDLIQSQVECRAAPSKVATADYNTELPFATSATTDHDIVV